MTERRRAAGGPRLSGRRSAFLAVAWALGLLVAPAPSSAQTASPVPLMRLADAYLEGEVVPYDPEAAYSYYVQARDLGDPTAGLRLAELQMRGVGVERDFEAGLAEITRRAEDGSSSALVLLGDAYARGWAGRIDPDAARAAWEKAAAAGRTDAMMRLAEFYRYGILAPESPGEARRYFEQAADSRDPEIVYLFGRALAEGDLGGAADVRRGLDILTTASTRGNGEAAVALALARIDGDGLPSNPRAGLAELTELAGRGNVAAALRLVEIHRDGRRVNRVQAVRKDLRKARQELDRIAPKLTMADKVRQELLIDVAAARAGQYAPLYDRLMEFPAGQRPDFVRRAVRSDENAFVYFVQRRLDELGFPVRQASGLLDRSTIGAIGDYCRSLQAETLCRNGPLSGSGVHVLSYAF